MVQDEQNKILGMLFGCAIGDALGAPVEFLDNTKPRTLDLILEHSSINGVVRLMPYKASDVADQVGIGAVTDDTTMTVCTAEAIRLALLKPKIRLFGDLINYSRECFLNWGAAQKNGENCSGFINPAIEWSAAVKKFWFKCAAGIGTIASLASGLEPTEANGGRGCGGMMRVAPLAVIPSKNNINIFELAKKHAEITHVETIAKQGTGVIAQLAHDFYNGISLEESISKVTAILNEEEDSAKCLSYFEKGYNAALTKPGKREVIDSLVIGEQSVFHAGPVLSQVIYAIISAENMQDRIKDIFTLAVTHRGDTDSVGAIVGSLMGIKHGYLMLPKEWINQIQLKNELHEIGISLAAALKKNRESAIVI